MCDDHGCSGSLSEAVWSKQSNLDRRYSLLGHMIDTTASSMVLWDKWLRPGLRRRISADLGPDAKKWVAVAAGLHDLGKASPVFAGQLRQENEGWVAEVREQLTADGFDLDVPEAAHEPISRHEVVSALHLAGGRIPWEASATEGWLPASALGHHGVFHLIQTGNERAYRRYSCGKWADERNQLHAEIMHAVGLPLDAKIPVASPATVILISGLVMLADRTASELYSVKNSQYTTKDAGDTAERLAKRVTWFTKRVEKTIGLYRDFDDANESILGGYEPRPLQAAAEGLGDGLWIAMAPTGTGKTEAAMLRHSEKRERIIFALPTQATTNSMMRRVQAFYEGTGNIGALAHSLADIEDFYGLSPANMPGASDDGQLLPSTFTKAGKSRIFAPVVVSTIDQVLVGALPLKLTHLRLLMLANAHIVIDEVHLLDQFQTELAKNMMSWWGATNTRVTLLTATMPTWQRDVLAKAYDPHFESTPIAFPSYQRVGEAPVEFNAEEYQVDVELVEHADPVDAHYSWAMGMLRQYPDARLGVVVNQIGRAQELATMLAKAGHDPIVLHSSLTAGHRAEITHELVRRIGKTGQDRGMIVIGTQAIEASLDIDLDAMSSDLAPAPSLIQRVGRVWRFDDPRRAGRLPIPHRLLRVVRATRERASLPYFESELNRAWAHLQGRTHLQMPSESQEFVESATLRFDEIDPGTADELSDAHKKINKVRSFMQDYAEQLKPGMTFATLHAMTSHAEDADVATRDIENAETVLLIDPSGNTPHAWTGTIEDLARVDPSDKNTLRLAVRATVSVNGKKARLARDLRPDSWNPLAHTLSHVIPLEVKDRVGYHLPAGLTIKDERGR